MIRWFVHNLTHTHTYAAKEGVGEFLTCGWRLLPTCVVLFRPAFAGADWHQIGSDGAMEDMMLAGTPEEAMALLRAAA